MEGGRCLRNRGHQPLLKALNIGHLEAASGAAGLAIAGVVEPENTQKVNRKVMLHDTVANPSSVALLVWTQCVARLSSTMCALSAFQRTPQRVPQRAMDLEKNLGLLTT